MAGTLKKWGKEDDSKKLFALFNSNQLDPNQTDLKSCKHAFEIFFQGEGRDYKNFGPLYRKKCAKFQLAAKLGNSHKRCKLQRMQSFALLATICFLSHICF
jgi:hypothetical protein